MWHNEQGVSRLLLLVGGALVILIIIVGLLAGSGKNGGSSNQSSEEFLIIKEWGVKLPLSEGDRDMYYTLVNYKSGIGQGAKIYSKDFNGLRNSKGTACKNADYPLFVMNRVTAAKGAQINNPDLPDYDPSSGLYKTYAFEQDYAFGGVHNDKIMPPCLIRSSEGEEMISDKAASEVYNAKVKALKEGFSKLQAAPEARKSQ